MMYCLSRTFFIVYCVRLPVAHTQLDLPLTLYIGIDECVIIAVPPVARPLALVAVAVGQDTVEHLYHLSVHLTSSLSDTQVNAYELTVVVMVVISFSVVYCFVLCTFIIAHDAVLVKGFQENFFIIFFVILYKSFLLEAAIMRN